MSDRPSRKGCRACLAVAVLAIVAAAALYGPVIRDFWNEGILQTYLFPQRKRAYAGDSVANLKAQHTALMLYHESEGQFPEASGWMDAIENRLRTADMDREEALKKLRRPDLHDQPQAYGYAMNDAASAKYKEDVPEPAKTPLTFETPDTARNAHGPASSGLRGGNAISIEGGLLKL
ncbi:MAG: hypothetical protein N2109_09775 [Fimbriimonadales bacterium]|nr:hypothetical protein [Fimbriimonadales bacterium]